MATPLPPLALQTERCSCPPVLCYGDYHRNTYRDKVNCIYAQYRSPERIRGKWIWSVEYCDYIFYPRYPGYVKPVPGQTLQICALDTKTDGRDHKIAVGTETNGRDHEIGEIPEEVLRKHKRVFQVGRVFGTVWFEPDRHSLPHGSDLDWSACTKWNTAGPIIPENAAMKRNKAEPRKAIAELQAERGTSRRMISQVWSRQTPDKTTFSLTGPRTRSNLQTDDISRLPATPYNHSSQPNAVGRLPQAKGSSGHLNESLLQFHSTERKIATSTDTGPRSRSQRSPNVLTKLTVVSAVCFTISSLPVAAAAQQAQSSHLHLQNIITHISAGTSIASSISILPLRNNGEPTQPSQTYWIPFVYVTWAASFVVLSTCTLLGRTPGQKKLLIGTILFASLNLLGTLIQSAPSTLEGVLCWGPTALTVSLFAVPVIMDSVSSGSGPSDATQEQSKAAAAFTGVVVVKAKESESDGPGLANSPE